MIAKRLHLGYPSLVATEKAPDSRPLNEAAVTYTEILMQNLKGPLGLPADAADFLLGVWGLTQVFDDAADGGGIDRPDLDKAVWFALVGMAINPFYTSNMQALTPVMATQVLKWQASDFAERGGNADAKSYAWRAGFYDLVLAVACICHGPEVATKLAPSIMAMYGETFAEYMREFSHA
jgi:hypothetical protein